MDKDIVRGMCIPKRTLFSLKKDKKPDICDNMHQEVIVLREISQDRKTNTVGSH